VSALGWRVRRYACDESVEAAQTVAAVTRAACWSSAIGCSEIEKGLPFSRR